MAVTRPERPFELGEWQVDPARGVISSRDTGAATRLEPRLMDLLLLFATSTGRVLGKDEIIANVWRGRAIGDDTLAAAVSRLRRALGETADNRYIETIPKRGYRFLHARAQQSAVAAPRKPQGEVADLVRHGEAALRAPLPAGLLQARHYFEAAIAREPSFASAHAGLADTLLAQHFAGNGDVAAARASAHAAVGLDMDLARAWSTLGMCTLLIERDFEKADALLSRAVGLEPDLSNPHRQRAFACACAGRFVEAEREARRSVELEPHSLAGRGLLLQILIAARRYQWALAAANETLAVAPHAAEAWYARAWANVFQGNEKAGVEAFFRGLELWGLHAERIAALKDAFARGGFATGCTQTADLFEEQGLLFKPRMTDIAILRVASREHDRAFAALEEALRRDDPYLLLLAWLPHFDALRADPRFVAFLARARPVR